MKKILLGLVITLIALPTFAANWVQIDPGFYIDTTTIQKAPYSYLWSSNSYYFWSKTFYPADKIIFNQIATNDTNLEIMDCRQRIHALKETNIYNKNGNVIFSYDYTSDLRFHNIAPGTTGEAIFDLICKTQNY